MAKRINRVEDKTKDKVKLKELLSSINASKNVLEKLEAEKKDLDKNIASKAQESVKKTELEKEAAEKLSTTMEKLKRALIELDIVYTETAATKAVLKEVSKEKSAQEKATKELVDNYESLKRNMDADRSAKLLKLNDELLLLKGVISNNDARKELLLSELVVLDKKMFNIKSLYKKELEQMDSRLEEKKKEFNGIDKRIELEIDSKTVLIKRAIESSTSELSRIEKSVASSKKLLFAITIDLQNLEREKSTLLKTLHLDQKKFALITTELKSVEEKIKQEIATLQESKNKEIEELKKIQTQRFGIIKANKELKRVYSYIEELYKQANVPMPKIEINIE